MVAEEGHSQTVGLFGMFSAQYSGLPSAVKLHAEGFKRQHSEPVMGANDL
jgi:hypothetical protein